MTRLSENIKKGSAFYAPFVLAGRPGPDYSEVLQIRPTRL